MKIPHGSSIIFLMLWATILPLKAALALDETSDNRLVTQSATSWIAPPSGFYPSYIADPRRAQSALLLMGFPETEIEQVGHNRLGIRLGGNYGLIRFHPESDTSRGIQVDLEAGFFTHFDYTEDLNNIGWDGVYGLFVSYKPHPQLAFRTGTLHDSAHVGDEYAEATGRQRIGYTRQEIIAGVSWLAHPRWRLYAEYAWAYKLNVFQKRQRLQLGTEYYGTRRFWHGRLSWYTALDLNMFQERGWRPATTAQLGLLLPIGPGLSRHRYALEFYNGRSTMGEFSFDDESYISLGWYVDL